ncbi:MAG: AMP-binding protein [Thermodesulfobacteriota bacterium]|nr:AMP-binding protein [Thermodesulfobacteriota bacterium]
MDKLTRSYYHAPGEIPPGVTLGEYFEKTAETYQEKDALIFRERRITWGELKLLVDRLTLAFIDLGIRRGDMIVILFPNRPEFIITLLAAARLGAVSVPVSERLRRKEIEYILRQTEAKAVVSVSEFWGFSFSALFQELRGVIPTLKQVIVSGKRRHPDELVFEELVAQEWEKRYPKDYYREVYLREFPVEADDLLEIIFTSGTTGTPKGVMHTHNTRCRSALGTATSIGLKADDVWLIMVPLSHTTALVNAFYSSVIKGSCQVLLETWNVEEALKEISRHRVTLPIGVPTMPIMMLQRPDFDQYDFSSVRAMVLAGAPLPIEVARQIIQKMGCYVTSAYGMTETAMSNITRLDDPVEVVCETVGRPQPGMEHKVVDQKRRIVPIRLKGEACARGQNVCIGYFKDPERTAQTIDEKGWIYSGDLATMDENGNLRIVGRIKDIIVRGGENISPTEIEDILYTLPKVAQVSVVAIPDERLGEKTCACIIPKTGELITQEEVKAFFKDKVAHFKIPDRVELMSEFPTTPSGKIKKNVLRDMMAEKASKEKEQKG